MFQKKAFIISLLISEWDLLLRSDFFIDVNQQIIGDEAVSTLINLPLDCDKTPTYLKEVLR